LKFLILSAGQLGKLIAEISTRSKEIDCVGFLDPDPSLHGKSFYDIPVLGSDDLLNEYFLKGIKHAIPSMGDLTNRSKLIKQCIDLGFDIPSIIDPSTILTSNNYLNKGVCVLYGSVISPSVIINDFTVVGSGVNILHDTNIGKNCMIGGGTTIGSSVDVGDNVSFGVGVVVASAASIKIGDNVSIAAGSVVLNNIPRNSFVLGNPARVIRQNN